MVGNPSNVIFRHKRRVQKHPKTPAKFSAWLWEFLQTNNSTAAAEHVYHVSYMTAAGYGTDNLKVLKSMPSIIRLAPKVRFLKPPPHPYQTHSARDKRYQLWKLEYAANRHNGTKAALLIYQVSNYNTAAGIAHDNLERMKSEERDLRQKQWLRDAIQTKKLLSWKSTNPKTLEERYCQRCGEPKDFLLEIHLCESCTSHLRQSI